MHSFTDCPQPIFVGKFNLTFLQLSRELYTILNSMRILLVKFGFLLFSARATLKAYKRVIFTRLKSFKLFQLNNYYLPTFKPNPRDLTDRQEW